LKIDFTAQFCFWTEQRLNGTQLLGLGLIKTLEVPNIIMVGNSLSFLMVTTVGNSTGLLNQKFWTDYTFRHKSGF
jgi:hypothetical protein